MALFPFGFMQSQSQPLLLDLYPNAVVAFSVRKLRTDYTGSSIRVRRSSDNAEQNIGFSGENLDTTALTSFCSGTNGFVTTWYDQSGNGINVTQTTASNQPQIVSSGSVLLVNGKPVIYTNNSTGYSNPFQYLKNTTQPNTNIPVTDFYAFQYNSILDASVSYQTAYDGGQIETQRGYFGLQRASNQMLIYEGALLLSYTCTTAQRLATNVRNSSNSQMYLNNALITTGNSGGNNPIIGLSFGVDYTNISPSDCYHQEFIRYSGVSSNISAINTNINDYYGIY